MGVYSYNKIGPYITVKGKITKTERGTIQTCSNEECVNHKSNNFVKSKFCSDCGSEVVLKKYSEEYSCTPRDVIREEFQDELYYIYEKDGIEVFIPNHSNPSVKKRPGCSEDDDTGHINLLEANPQEEIQWFKERYKNIILKLEEYFGVECVEYCWGVVHYYN